MYYHTNKITREIKKYYLTKENNQTNKINIIIQINYNKYIIQIIFLVLWIPLLTPLSLKIFFRSKIPLYKLYNTTLFDLSFAKDPKYKKIQLPLYLHLAKSFWESLWARGWEGWALMQKPKDKRQDERLNFRERLLLPV